MTLKLSLPVKRVQIVANLVHKLQVAHNLVQTCRTAHGMSMRRLSVATPHLIVVLFCVKSRAIMILYCTCDLDAHACDVLSNKAYE